MEFCYIVFWFVKGFILTLISYVLCFFPKLVSVKFIIWEDVDFFFFNYAQLSCVDFYGFCLDVVLYAHFEFFN